MTTLRVTLVIGVLVILCVNCFHTSGRAQELKKRERRTAWHYLTRSVERQQPFGFVLSISPKCNSCRTKVSNESVTEGTTDLSTSPGETTTVLSTLETITQDTDWTDSSLEGQDYTLNTNIYSLATTIEPNSPGIETTTSVEPSTIDLESIWTDLSTQENQSDSYTELTQDLPTNEYEPNQGLPGDAFGDLNQELPGNAVADQYQNYDADSDDDDYYGDIPLPDQNTTNIQ